MLHPGHVQLPAISFLLLGAPDCALDAGWPEDLGVRAIGPHCWPKCWPKCWPNGAPIGCPKFATAAHSRGAGSGCGRSAQGGDTVVAVGLRATLNFLALGWSTRQIPPLLATKGPGTSLGPEPAPAPASSDLRSSSSWRESSSHMLSAATHMVSTALARSGRGEGPGPVPPVAPSAAITAIRVLLFPICHLDCTSTPPTTLFSNPLGFKSESTPDCSRDLIGRKRD